MTRATKKQKKRLLLLTIIVVPLLTLFVSDMFSCWSQVYKNVKEKNELENELTEKLEEEKKLNKEITKLNDPEYIAKHAREKYLYSKSGEIIIRIDEDEEKNN